MYPYKFEYYRFQLVPKKVVQLSIDNVAYTSDEIKAKKNEYFSEVLTKTTFKGKKGNLPYRIVYEKNNIFVLFLSNPKPYSYIHDFQKQQGTTEPFSIIVIDNNPENQLMAISRNTEAFSDTKTVVKILSQTINKHLDHYNVVLHIEPIFQKEEFWKIVGGKKEEISMIRFELIKPNLTNISGCLKDELKRVIDTTNSHKTVVEFNAPARAALEDITPSNNDINGLVDYSANGGGNIGVKFKHDRKKYQTAESIKVELETTEVEIQNANPAQLDAFVDSICSKLKRR